MLIRSSKLFSHGMSKPASRHLYDTLGISPDASSGQVKKAYMKLARVYHPDKNPSAGDKFKEITTAYDILSDPSKRDLYDQFGDAAVKEGLQNFTPPTARDKPAHSTEKKSASVYHQISLSLEELYNGKTVGIHFRRKRRCHLCFQNEGRKKCSSCHGTGQVKVAKQISPQRSVPVTVECKECRGCGWKFASNECQECHGQRLRTEETDLDVYIGRGTLPGQELLFAGEGDESYTEDAGDVIFTIHSKPHRRFQLDGKNLHAHVTIPLLDALTGASVKLEHLDGRVLKLVAEDVIEPQDTRLIPSEGFPNFKDPTESGDLIVHFTIRFPNRLLTSQRKLLEQVLPSDRPSRSLLETSEEDDEDHQTIVLENPPPALNMEESKEHPEDLPPSCAQQ